MRFSVVKRNVLASAYRNGQVVIWDTSQVFTKPKDEVSIAAKKFVFGAHENKPCTGIAFSQVNHLLLASCGMDHKIHFFDITQGKMVKKIDANANVPGGSQVTLARTEALSCIAFCNDGCTIAVGSSAGRIITYNLKDVKGSKRQLQVPRMSDSGVALSITTLLFKRPIKAEKSERGSISAASAQKTPEEMRSSMA